MSLEDRQAEAVKRFEKLLEQLTPDAAITKRNQFDELNNKFIEIYAQEDEEREQEDDDESTILHSDPKLHDTVQLSIDAETVSVEHSSSDIIEQIEEFLEDLEEEIFP